MTSAPLVAVSAGSNRSKADQGWLPSATGRLRQPPSDWGTERASWGLASDTAEQAALAGCLNAPVAVTAAR